jgi:hypothetical protein
VAGRYEIVIDFTGFEGRTITLVNNPMGDFNQDDYCWVGWIKTNPMPRGSYLTAVFDPAFPPTDASAHAVCCGSAA